MSENKLYINIKSDYSLYNRFYEAVKILATETGSLNKRIYKAYFNFIAYIHSSEFTEVEIKDRLQYIKDILADDKKCIHYKHTHGGRLYCHWQESKKIAENIFYIYHYILDERNNKG